MLYVIITTISINARPVYVVKRVAAKLVTVLMQGAAKRAEVLLAPLWERAHTAKAGLLGLIGFVGVLDHGAQVAARVWELAASAGDDFSLDTHLGQHEDVAFLATKYLSTSSDLKPQDVRQDACARLSVRSRLKL